MPTDKDREQWRIRFARRYARPEAREKIRERARLADKTEKRTLRYRHDPDLSPRHKARSLAREAVKAGKLQRQPCEVCGDAKVHAHHDDYTSPLDVRWLCVTHHSEHHRNDPKI